MATGSGAGTGTGVALMVGAVAVRDATVGAARALTRKACGVGADVGGMIGASTSEVVVAACVGAVITADAVAVMTSAAAPCAGVGGGEAIVLGSVTGELVGAFAARSGLAAATAGATDPSVGAGETELVAVDSGAEAAEDADGVDGETDEAAVVGEGDSPVDVDVVVDVGVDVVLPEDVVVVDPRLPPLKDTLLVGDVCCGVEELADSAGDPPVAVPTDAVADPEPSAAGPADVPDVADPVAEEPVEDAPPEFGAAPPPDPEPSSANAIPAPLTRAAPKPSAIALVPSHLYGSRGERCRPRAPDLAREPPDAA